jgi:hypothetical protein
MGTSALQRTNNRHFLIGHLSFIDLSPIRKYSENPNRLSYRHLSPDISEIFVGMWEFFRLFEGGNGAAWPLRPQKVQWHYSSPTPPQVPRKDRWDSNSPKSSATHFSRFAHGPLYRSMKWQFHDDRIHLLRPDESQHNTSHHNTTQHNTTHRTQQLSFFFPVFCERLLRRLFPIFVILSKWSPNEFCEHQSWGTTHMVNIMVRTCAQKKKNTNL